MNVKGFEWHTNDPATKRIDCDCSGCSVYVGEYFVELAQFRLWLCRTCAARLRATTKEIYADVMKPRENK